MAPALPPAFVARMEDLLGAPGALSRLLEARSRPAVRVNTLKTDEHEALRRLHALGVATEPVPFAPGVHFVDDPLGRPLGALWEHRSGQLFFQDAASALPVLALDPRPGEAVLDLCAAPGGKSAHIAERMRNTGTLVANEPMAGRRYTLVSNLDRTGALNTIVTRFDGGRRRLPMRFDRVLVDAPCSNLGSIHTDWRPALAYTPERVRTLVGIQRALVETAFHALRPGGVLVYSTCTLEPEENEGIVSWLLDRYPVEMEAVPAPLDAPGRTIVGGTRYRDECALALRLHAGDVGTDGFFVARLRKVQDAPEVAALGPIPSRRVAVRAADPPILRGIVAEYGLRPGPLDGAHAFVSEQRVFASTAPEPDAAAAWMPERVGLDLAKREPDGWRLSFDATTLAGRGADRRLELPPEDARRWLAGGDAHAPRGAPWSVVTCRDEPLGCSRAFGPTLPSYVPKDRRVPQDGPFAGFLV